MDLRWVAQASKWLLTTIGLAAAKKIQRKLSNRLGKLPLEPDAVTREEEAQKDPNPMATKKYDVRNNFPLKCKENTSFGSGRGWVLTNLGIKIDNGSIPRSDGTPATVTKIIKQFGKEINKWGNIYGVPPELIIATIATESSGLITARREEPGFHSEEVTPDRISAGLMQTLLSTAREALGENDIDCRWLEIPENSIQAGTAYIYRQRPITLFNPPVVAAAYNSGGVYLENRITNPWKLRCYPIGTGHHITKFVMWFNDCVYVMNERKGNIS